jgi:hypothetical protein
LRSLSTMPLRIISSSFDNTKKSASIANVIDEIINPR